MSNNPYVGLAKFFNKYKNREYLGTMLAEVIEPLPNLKLKLLNGNMEIDSEIEGEQIFIARSITNRIDIDVTFSKFESKDNVDESISYKSFSSSTGLVVHTEPIILANGSPTPVPSNITNVSLNSGNISEIKSNKERKNSGKFKGQFLVTLKKGDFVLVITNEKEDQFFIVDVMDNIKEVKDRWEYYQKS